MDSPMRAKAITILRAMALPALVLAFMLILAPSAHAGDGCQWESGGWLMECRSGYWGMGTGCVGLRNKTGQEVRFYVNSPDNGVNDKRRMGKGKEARADYKKSLAVHTCKKKINGKWKKVHCSACFTRTKNEDSGGGCGCKNFNCLHSW